MGQSKAIAPALVSSSFCLVRGERKDVLGRGEEIMKCGIKEQTEEKEERQNGNEKDLERRGAGREGLN